MDYGRHKGQLSVSFSASVLRANLEINFHSSLEGAPKFYSLRAAKLTEWKMAGASGEMSRSHTHTQHTFDRKLNYRLGECDEFKSSRINRQQFGN